MERLGMVVDLAHASEATVAAAMKVCTRPVMCSHTHVNGHGATHPRFYQSGNGQGDFQSRRGDRGLASRHRNDHARRVCRAEPADLAETLATGACQPGHQDGTPISSW